MESSPKERLERVQKLALRMCGGTWDTKYEELLTMHMFGLPMLKLIHGHYFYPEHLKK